MFLAAMALAAAAPALPPAEAIAAPGPQGELMGTLQRSAGPTGAVVLIVPGSGPTDRDGNNPLGVKAATYRLLAESLALHGVASVRIDKRGMFASAGAVPDANAVTISDYATDARNWTAAIKARTGATCVWLLGHSEGALVALVAAQDGKGLCGLILVAGAGRPLSKVLKGQLHANPANAPLLAAADQAIDNLSAGQRVDTAKLPAPLQPLFAAPVQGFLIDAFRHDPARLIARLHLPVLIVQGDQDLQVGLDDARSLKAAQPKAALCIVAGVNHVLKPVPTDNRQANLAAYADPHLPLAEAVSSAIVDFVQRQSPRGKPPGC